MAIVLWPMACFKEKLEMTSPNVLRHELIHFDQMRRVGILRFYAQYIWEYICGLAKFLNHRKAYLNISFEREAYEKQAMSTIDPYPYFKRS